MNGASVPTHNLNMIDKWTYVNRMIKNEKSQY